MIGTVLIYICLVINLIFVVKLVQRGEFGGSNSLINCNAIVNDNAQYTSNFQINDTALNKDFTQDREKSFPTISRMIPNYSYKKFIFEKFIDR